MKKIGQGFYYNVYDLGNGRVRKIPLSQVSQLFQLFAWYWLTPNILIEELRRAPHSRASREKQFAVSKQVAYAAPRLFGHPVFDGDSYEQDKAIPVGSLIGTLSENDFLNICAEYVQAIHALWEKGIGETVFNFTLNAGIDGEGKVILIDTNEYTLDTEEMRKEILNKRFLKASSFKRLPEKYKDPIKKLFEDGFSIEEFTRHWKGLVR